MRRRRESLRRQVSEKLQWVAFIEGRRKKLGGRAAGITKNDVAYDILQTIFPPGSAPFNARMTAAEIAALRAELGISKPDMAHLFNTSVKTITRWERGTQKPSGIACRLLRLVKRKGIEILD